MKIAFVQDWLNGFAGGEQVLLALHELYPEAPIYTSVYNSERTPQFSEAIVRTTYLQKFSYLRNHHQIAIPLMPLAFESLDLKGFDVIVSIGGGLAKGVITQPDQRHISYCNTPMRYLWHIGGDSRAQGIIRSQVAHSLRMWDVVSASRVDQFVANSQTVADRIGKFYRMPAEVIYPPVNTSAFKPNNKPSEKYFLSVGRLISYKRVDLAVRACMQTKSPLKVVGTGPELDSLKNMASKAPWIEFLGRVSDAELQDLYSKTKGFLFGAEEDFGIVPVEAMSAGRPIIAFGKGGATESIVDGSTGIFFSQQIPESMAEAIERFNSMQWSSEVIRNRSEAFDKSIFQKKMREIIER